MDSKKVDESIESIQTCLGYLAGTSDATVSLIVGESDASVDCCWRAGCIVG